MKSFLFPVIPNSDGRSDAQASESPSPVMGGRITSLTQVEA